VAANLDSITGIAGSKVFRQEVAPVYLRRNQSDVLHELPEKIEIEDWVEFTVQDKINYRGATASGNYMAMRRAAYEACNAKHSAKLARLVEIVEEAEQSGLKVIVFSYFLDVLETIAVTVPGKVFGPLTGALSPSARHELIQEFIGFPRSALLVSQIQAGGVGLNIQAASVVIIAEPQLKPSTEDQAIARCHRMGQARRVQVHRLLSEDSVDEKVRRILLQKAAQFDEYARKSEVKDASSEAREGMYEEELKELTEVGESGSAKAIVRQEQDRLGLPITV
jgi:SNF2 family DNA or RNA helicase